MFDRHRPRVTLLLPESVVPGQRVRGTAELELDHPLEIRAVRLELWRVCDLRIGWSGPCLGPPERLGQSELHGAGQLPVGRLRRSFELALPAELLPTLRGEVAWRRYECRVTFDSASSDVTSCFELRVDPPPGRAPGEPVFAVEPPRGSAGDSPYIELSLTSDVLEAGTHVAGAVAAGGVTAEARRHLELQLVRHERFRCAACGSRQDRKQTQGSSVLTVPGPGVAVPFHLELPADLLPSGGEQGWSIAWRLEARLPRSLAPDVVLRAPLTVVRPGTRPAGDNAPALAAAPPSVGDERQRCTWQEAAEKTGLQLRGGVLQGAVSGTDVELTVHLEADGASRSRLIGDLSYPDLGLDLHVERMGPLGRLFGGGRVALLQDPLWDGRHQVVVREAAQVAPLGALLWPALHTLEVTRLTDESATVERAYDPYSVLELVEFCGALQGLAAALDEARRAIPPPASMATALPVWQSLAHDLDGTLCQGRMAVQGQRGGLPVEATTRWSASAEPLATRLTVAAPASLERPELSWEAHAPEPEGMAHLPDRAAQLLRELHVAGSVRLDGTGAAIETAAPAFDEAPLVELLDGLVQLCHLLVPRTGPYR